MRIAHVIGVIGRVLVVAGLLLLFYTSYLLWGTSVYTRKAQTDLARRVATSPLVAHGQATGDIPAAKPAAEPKPGDPLFTIVIPRIGVRTVVVEGVEAPELKLGPGHFPEHPWPGERGNVPISGHRTTFGAPFFRLDELQVGDAIAIESGPARYRYTVAEKAVVSPRQLDVVEDHGRDELTLTTCNPKFSATQRLVVHARYEGPELIPVATDQPASPGSDGRQVPSGTPTLVPARPPAIPADVLLLTALSISSALGALALTKRFRAASAWAAVVLIGGVGLWTSVFPQVLRLMPANY